jgi:hypothetical protein
MEFLAVGAYVVDSVVFWLVPLTISMQTPFQKILKKQFELEKKLLSLDNEVDMSN